MKFPQLFKILLILTFLLAVPGYASLQDDDIDEKLERMIEGVEELEYDVIAIETSGIKTILTLTYTLDPGTYHAFADYGPNIRDLGMFVYSECGIELDSHSVSYESPLEIFDYTEDGLELKPHLRTPEPPYVDFVLENRETVDFELEVFEFEKAVDEFDEYYDQGDICFLIARESDE